MSRTFKILILNWPRTRKFNRLLHAGKAIAFDCHALITFYVQFLCSDWSKFDRWVHVENLCSVWKLAYWLLKLTEFCVILWCFKLSFSTWYQYKMKYSCYQDCSVIHGWFVYCAFCWQMHRLSSHWKSDFGWHRFQKWGYSLALAWGVRGLKSLKRSWNTWWPSEVTSRLVSLSNYCLWCVFFFERFSCLEFNLKKTEKEQTPGSRLKI